MKSILSMIPQLVRASFENDMRTVESSSLTLIRKLKKDYPDVAEEIAKAISYHGVGAAVTRSVGIDPPPTDKDTFMSLARVEEPIAIEPKVVLSDEVSKLIERFIRERGMAEKLLASGVKPPTSLLLYGPPGVGKTFLTSLLSYKLNLPLITLDLASSISSYLGKTGQNLKKVIDYARSTPSILFLDEFDAVAKRRDDPSDLGELKRIVNVLLKELEEWPSHSIVVAATNHADMLDKAIWRRFDRAIEINLPNLTAREFLWAHYLNSYLSTIDEGFIQVLAKVTEGCSAADISQLSERIIRQVIVDGSEPIEAIISQVKSVSDDNKFNSLFAKAAKEILGNKVTQKTIAKWLGISPSTLSHHLKTNKEE
ncbi:AAA family ATPase [Brevibacillus borstelensis]|jgi:SpoVK/Ycf46/Vps4 family AAA+-type ATPase|uniref:AAA family ATPase n=1 Tax=Brevibacillus borstelensis TaxID=45462 RepID=UPI0004F29BC7|nr:ATP-binding protein [Brevibacillus borstelensis]KKX52454.1 ATPase AAA [Brevibacillus borstelensis cifa_chp40]